MQEIFDDEIATAIMREKSIFVKIPAKYKVVLGFAVFIVLYLIFGTENENLIDVFNSALSWFGIYIAMLALIVSIYERRDWEKICIKEKRLRKKYGYIFDAIKNAEKGYPIEINEFSIFAEYYKDLFGTELQSLKELNIELVEYDLSARRELCKYDVFNKKFSRRLSSMVEEDWLVLEKWYISLCQSELKKVAANNKRQS